MNEIRAPGIFLRQSLRHLGRVLPEGLFLLVDLVVAPRVAGYPREDEAAEAVLDEPAVDIFDEVGDRRGVPGLLEDQG